MQITAGIGRDWDLIPLIFTKAFGWAIYSLILIFAIHILICAIFRLILVVSQDLINVTLDGVILLMTRSLVLIFAILIDFILYANNFEPDEVNRVQGKMEEIPPVWQYKLRSFMLLLAFCGQVASRIIIYFRYQRSEVRHQFSNEVFSSWTLFLLSAIFISAGVKKTLYGLKSGYLLLIGIMNVIPLQVILSNQAMNSKFWRLFKINQTSNKVSPEPRKHVIVVIE